MEDKKYLEKLQMEERLASIASERQRTKNVISSYLPAPVPGKGESSSAKSCNEDTSLDDKSHLPSLNQGGGRKNQKAKKTKQTDSTSAVINPLSPPSSITSLTTLTHNSL
jgi:hypothetical protein